MDWLVPGAIDHRRLPHHRVVQLPHNEAAQDSGRTHLCRDHVDLRGNSHTTHRYDGGAAPLSAGRLSSRPLSLRLLQQCDAGTFRKLLHLYRHGATRPRCALRKGPHELLLGGVEAYEDAHGHDVGWLCHVDVGHEHRIGLHPHAHRPQVLQCREAEEVGGPRGATHAHGIASLCGLCLQHWRHGNLGWDWLQPGGREVPARDGGADRLRAVDGCRRTCCLVSGFRVLSGPVHAL
mmetsp:Transcript_94006/g.223750  ORF Transcript_94006/g.223750 Transcript_94006/m.223750 type:complete len:235 (-) Transcript_94006:923-1627(-)